MSHSHPPIRPFATGAGALAAFLVSRSLPPTRNESQP